MRNLNKLIPRGSKRTLMMMAAVVWMFAGYQVIHLGYPVVLNNKEGRFLSLAVAAVVFGIFFNFVFKKMARKHQKRIMNNAKEKVCLFAFFDKKGYIIMAGMMTMGLLIRGTKFINPIYWAPFYVGLGAALFLGGCLFMFSWVRFNRIFQS